MATPDPLKSPSSSSPAAVVDVTAITKAVKEEFDRERNYFKYAQEQGKADREYFKHLFDWVLRGVGILTALALVIVGLAGWYLGKSLREVRDDARAEVKRELDAVRTEVRKRIDDEFKTERITAIVLSAVKDRSEKEFRDVIRAETVVQVERGIHNEAPTIKKTVQEETKLAVRDLQPTISGIVGTETKAQVERSVTPIQSELKGFGNLIRIGTLATMARSDDRKSFDQLIPIAQGRVAASEEERKIAAYTLTAVVRQKHNGFLSVPQFKITQSPAAMKELLRTSTYPNERMAAIWHFPDADKSILPMLVTTISSDPSLDVMDIAIRKFNQITGQEFEFPNVEGLLAWWASNKGKFPASQ